MSSSPRLSRPWIIALAWLLLALVFTPQAVLINLMRPEPLASWHAALRQGQIFVMWAIFTPIVLAALRRWPPSGARKWRHAALHLVIGLLLVALHLAILVASLAPQIPDMDWSEATESVLVSVGATNVLMCAALYAAAAALAQSDERRRVERALVQARITALRAQLQPHFLFNTLNALAELLHRDPPLAEALLLKLSALLRRALDDSAAATLTLGEELSFLEDYLAIQHALLGTRLRVQREIAPNTLDWPVPPLLLQPLVENALRHGIAPRRAGGTLRLAARVVHGGLVIDIENDLDAGAREPGTGIGLRNTRERLAAQYGERAALRIEESEGRYRVRLEIPA